MSYKFCVCETGIKSKKFNSGEDLLKWAKEQFEKIKIGDLVEVIDTGNCYTHIDEGELIRMFDLRSMSIETYTDIINHLNHKGLGYMEDVYSISKKDCVFKVIAETESKYIIEAYDGEKTNRYWGGYYIIGKRGVKKCQEI